MPEESLIPQPAQAAARPRRRLAFGFGSRFLIALLLGLLWIIPAWWAPRLIAAMFLWDGVVLAAWIVDLRRLPLPGQIHASRLWTSALARARPTQAAIELRNSGSVPIQAAMIDETPVAFRDEPPSLQTAIAAGGESAVAYPIVPRERGDANFGPLYLRYRSGFGLAERWAAADLSQTVRVLPDIVQAREHALYLIRSRQVEMEKRRRRQRGSGREFESLREYRQGDELRDIHWPATARRHSLVTRTYQVERSQAIWIVVDAGRLLRAHVQAPDGSFHAAKLDYSVDAALALAHVAMQSGDRVGMLAYGRMIQQAAAPARGSRHLRQLVDALAQVRGEIPEADHGRAVRALLRMQTRRSLVIWITDFAETPTTPEVIEQAAAISRRHLVVFAAVSQPDLGQLARAVPESAEEMFRHAAAIEVVQRRELLMRGLRQRGVIAVDLAPGVLSSSLINQYLEVKDRNLL